MDWEAIKITGMQLTDTEHRYYGDMFTYCCENADTENVPMVNVMNLLSSANLPREVMYKIVDMFGGTKYTRISRKQFYAALKLVATYQAGLEVNKEAIMSPLDEIALPRFNWPSNNEENKNPEQFRNLPPRQEERVPDSTTESESEPDSPQRTGGSTESPTPTNSVTQERNEDVAEDYVADNVPNTWQRLFVSEEQRQLLGTEEESSERHTSDEGEVDPEICAFPPEEIYIINDELRDYYKTQFTQMQPDPDGLLAGSVARTFFEKSRLPVTELRRIWQMADVTRDGALSLQEFYVAMHLVVLRRNHISLPDSLPPSLANLITKPVVPPPLPAVQVAPVPPPVPAKQNSPSSTEAPEKSKEWTKFVDSPTGTGSSSTLTSPGPKPVNFDFHKAAVESNPKILHPVPLRLTPEANILAAANGASANNGLSLRDDEIPHPSTTLIQRPLAKKPIVLDENMVTPKKEPPPPPPPRPYRTHARSSSLDLNKLGKNGQQAFLGAPPLVPPRVSPGITSPRKLVGQKSEGESQKPNSENQAFIADFSQFSPKTDVVESTSTENSIHPLQQFTGICGAFQIYRKPSPRREGQDDISQEDIEEGKKMSLQELREKNAELRQVCEELTKELASALQERINLRAKLLLLP